MNLDCSNSVHDIVGRKLPKPMEGKPYECFETETSLIHEYGDIFIVTYPKTGTTLVQYITHLLRGGDDNFEDIHQVCPHTSSSWFIDQDVNMKQCRSPRIFKSHRSIQQVSPFSNDVKYISTIRDPMQTIKSNYFFRHERGNACEDETSITDFIQSKRWNNTCITDTCIGNYYEQMKSFLRCINATNFLLIPYEELVDDTQREKWIILIANFMNIEYNDDLIKMVGKKTLKHEMLSLESKFDESWCRKKRDIVGRVHPSIKQDSCKVSKNEINLNDIHDISAAISLQEKLWEENISNVIGFKTYNDVRKFVCEYYLSTQF